MITKNKKLSIATKQKTQNVVLVKLAREAKKERLSRLSRI